MWSMSSERPSSVSALASWGEVVRDSTHPAQGPVTVTARRSQSPCRVSAHGSRVVRERSPYAGATVGLLEAEGHIGAILLGPYNESVCATLSCCRGQCLTRPYPAASGSRRPLRCVSRGAAAFGRLRRARLSSLLRAAVAQVSPAQSSIAWPRCHRTGICVSLSSRGVDVRLPLRPCKTRCLCRTSHCS